MFKIADVRTNLFLEQAQFGAVGRILAVVMNGSNLCPSHSGGKITCMKENRRFMCLCLNQSFFLPNFFSTFNYF